jgi:ankyrin repeat protein
MDQEMTEDLVKAAQDDEFFDRIVAMLEEETDHELILKTLRSHPELKRYDLGGGGVLHCAISRNDLKLVKSIIDLGYSLNSRDATSSKTTPLERAIHDDNFDAVRLLLEAGANPNLCRSIYAAVNYRHSASLEIVKLLDSYGADLKKITTENQFSKDGRMNLIKMAHIHGKEDVVAYLASRGHKILTNDG